MSQIKFIKERCTSCDWGTCTDYMQQHLLQVSNFYNDATQQHLIREENFLLYQKTNLRSYQKSLRVPYTLEISS